MTLLETSGDPNFIGALAIVGRCLSRASRQYESWVVRDCDVFRGMTVDYIVWLREPTDHERVILSECLGRR